MPGLRNVFRDVDFSILEGKIGDAFLVQLCPA